MNKLTLSFRFALLALPIFTYSRATELATSSPAQTINVFYKKYLNFRYIKKDKAPSLTFSTSFRALRNSDLEACKKYAGTDICGWGADGDVYLDTQETDPKLNYVNSRIQISEIKSDIIRVKLNLYPGKVADASTERLIDFHMKQENHKWVVDDLVSHGNSARKEMLDEIASLSNK